MEKFNVTMNTSLRSHGKWGDFLVALIPLAWCGNIIVNSNFILRMLEWQNESTLFTVRIQGKQWYWVYKYNADTNYKLYNIYINVGNGNWMKTTAPSNLTFNHNNSILNFVYDYEFKQIHRKNMSKFELRHSPLNLYSLYGNIRKTKEITPDVYYKLENYCDISKMYKQIDFSINTDTMLKKWAYSNFLSENYYTLKHRHNLTPITQATGEDIKVAKTPIKWTNTELSSYYTENYKSKYMTTFHKIRKHKKWRLRIPETIVDTADSLAKTDNQYSLFDFTENHNYRGSPFESDKMDELVEPSETTFVKTAKFPVRIIKGTLNKHNLSILKSNSDISRLVFFNYRVNKSDIAFKTSLVEPFWGFRQKRYKKMRYFSFPLHPKYNSITYTYVRNFLHNQPIKTYKLYTAIKNNKYKNELMPVTLARRLLRTKRTLVLPAHINMTLITNSYDVIHSWFVPGLGLKIDCVPGRSTHHTLYIDNVGFYYGQCAEICGRYHHHMPIRVCALPYEHFMLWWQTKGMPRMYRSKFFLKYQNVVLEKFRY
jgi:heme/copper-type cytochrome/quinol oxidase subunit 2